MAMERRLLEMGGRDGEGALEAGKYVVSLAGGDGIGGGCTGKTEYYYGGLGWNDLQ